MRTRVARRLAAALCFALAIAFAAFASTRAVAQQTPTTDQTRPTDAKTDSQKTNRRPDEPNAKPTTQNPTSQNPARPSRQMDDREIVHSDLVTLNVTVTDTYGRYVSGLTKNAFTIFDEKTPQEITFFSDDDAPVSLGIVFDVSGSMGGEKISKAREALKHFVETSQQGDEYFLIGFNQQAQLLLDRTRNSDALLDKLTMVQTHGQTALYDACYLGVEKVQRGTHPKKAILLISDGQDNSSRYTFNELRRMLKESDVIIYAIGILDGSDATSSLGIGGQAILDELASVSGGKAFFPSTSADMNDIFERIALELRHQYAIGFRPTNFANDGKWHRLKVKIQPPRGLPHLFVRSKEGYFALANPR